MQNTIEPTDYDIDNDEIIESNKEIVNDDPVSQDELNDLVIYSRDWTIDTIISQIDSGNIDLNPEFQRRNVWGNDKRSKLIESLIVGYPVPEVVLAELPNQKKKYVVIDGKQRLLAIQGFIKPSLGYWSGKAELKSLTIRKDIEGLSFDTLGSDDARLLYNADLRCTILTGYSRSAVLYDIFYRLNTGSVPLSMQELRNSIYKGGFSEFITKFTNETIPLHQIMSLSGPDKRFKDIEIILKFLSINFSDKKYSGNLKQFLDGFTEESNSKWNSVNSQIESACSAFNDSCSMLISTFHGESKHVGRKWIAEKTEWETRFNRSVFEVLVQYMYSIVVAGNEDIFTLDENKDKFVSAVQDAFENVSSLSGSVSSSTKTIEQHRNRFQILFNSLNASLGLSIDIPDSLK
ncbi:DUF262 domain-containing protein [Salmonella enterica]|uniref:DUF262 domain-containing protein n=1 Tax=Salmonella enterica TaxID=28901 RepID=UPI003F42042A